jgi:hypothetical protein
MPILITQVGLYLLLLVGGGLVYFAAAVLVASLVSAEYTARSVAFAVILLPTILSAYYLPLCLNNRRLAGAFSGKYSHLSPFWTSTMAGNMGKFVCRSAVAVGFDHGRPTARALKAFYAGNPAPVIG